MTFPQGIDFRNTSGYVTDPANCTYEIYGGFTSSGNYPRTTPQGNTVGYEGNYSGVDTGYRDRSTSVDPRLAGLHQTTSNTAFTYRIDLPAAGAYKIGAACGDASNAQACYLEVLDTSSSLGVLVNGTTSNANRWFDATGVERTNVTWPTSNALASKTFSTTIARFKIGSGTAANGHISHLWMESAASGAAFAATMAASCNLSGTLSTQIPLATTMPAASSLAAALTTSIRLSATMAAASAFAGTLTTAIPFAATMQAIATMTGTLSAGAALSAVMSSRASLTAALTTAIPLSATMAASANLSGTLSAGAALSATMAASSTMSGALTTAIRFAATMAAGASFTGSFSGTAAQLSATMAARATFTGTLTTALPLAAVMSTRASFSGNLSTPVGFAATMRASSTFSGSLTTSIPLTAVMTARSTLTGTLTDAGANSPPAIELTVDIAPQLLAADLRTRSRLESLFNSENWQVLIETDGPETTSAEGGSVALNPVHALR